MPLDAYQVLDRVYGVITRSETKHQTIPIDVDLGWIRILKRNSNRVGVTIQNLNAEGEMLLSIGRTPQVDGTDVPAVVIASRGSYYANLWDDFDTPTNAFWIRQSADTQSVALLEVLITPQSQRIS